MSKVWTTIASFAFLVTFAVYCEGQEQESLDFTAAGIEYFENEVRPLLVEHCLECHGADPDEIRGGLRLTSHSAMLAGGDTGPAVVPGDPDDSLLMSAIRYEDFDMPPEGELPEEAVAVFEHWIEMGAPDPRTGTDLPVTAGIDMEAGKQFWSFQPVSKPPVPEVENEGWGNSPIDRFVLRQLETAGISPNEAADRHALLRRVYLTLIGLPPDESEIVEFCSSERPLQEDLERLVDRLLASPRFGERWGRHWLDVARFAESSGGGRSLMFPDAWRYRDYVIDAYNNDKPFDRFVKEQLAGDLLPFDSHALRSEQLVATGFLVLGPINYEQQDKELLRMEMIDEQIDTVGRAFMAMTLGCARCHDHKFDPVPASDYYALAGIFKSTESLVDGNVSSYVTTSIATDEEKRIESEYKRRVSDLTDQLNEAVARLRDLGGLPDQENRNKSVRAASLAGIVIDNTAADLTGLWTDSTSVAYFVNEGYIHENGQPAGANIARFVPEFEHGGEYEVRLAYSPGGNRASNVKVTVDHQDGQAVVYVNQSQKPPIDDLFISLGSFRFEADNVAAVTISNENADGVVIVDAVQFLSLSRPDAESTDANEGVSTEDEVQPDEVSSEIQEAREQVKSLEQRLTELKQDAPHPTALAMSVKEAATPVNSPVHIRGSVRNLGEVVERGFLTVCSDEQTVRIPVESSGRLELAEWIASPDHPLTARVYVNRVWRHVFGRGLVESTDNFGLMGTAPSHPELLDYLASEFVENGWSTRSLIREMVLSRTFRSSTRLAPLCVEIDPENRLLWRANRLRLDAEVIRDSMLFVSGDLDYSTGGLTIRKLEQYDLGYEFDSNRRSVYVPAFRNSMLDLFEIFDIANPNLVTGNRTATTLPTQSLFLMNSPFVIEQANHAAVRLLESAVDTEAARIETAFLQTLGRPPTEDEMKLSVDFLARFDTEDDAQNQEAWSGLFHTLFASLDFRFMN